MIALSVWTDAEDAWLLFAKEYNWKSASREFTAKQEEERQTDKCTSFRSSNTAMVINDITLHMVQCNQIM